MKAIALCGSPRTSGNTEYLLRHCLSVLEKHGVEGELLSLRDYAVKPCRGCAACKESRDLTCSQTDDDFQEIFGRMLKADIIVVGSPVHFGSAAPVLMSLLGRAGYVSRANGHVFSRKLGGPIVVARRAGQNFTYAQLMYWFIICDMVVPGSFYWNVAFGEGPGDVAKDAEGLAVVEHFAENLAWLAKKTLG